MKRIATVTVVALVLLTLSAGTLLAQNERQGGRVFATDPNPASGNPTGGAGTDLVADGGFEAGSPNPSWTEASTNFGSPLCTLGLCGNGGGSAGPANGSWWAWFGGIGTLESASVSQTIQGGASDTCTLSFNFWIGASSGNGIDFLEVSIGGGTVFSVLENTSGFTSYTPVSIDVSSAIDGTAQLLSIDSTISGTPAVTNFNVDDVALICQSGVPTTPRSALVLLALLMMIGALIIWRRQATI